MVSTSDVSPSNVQHEFKPCHWLISCAKSYPHGLVVWASPRRWTPEWINTSYKLSAHLSEKKNNNKRIQLRSYINDANYHSGVGEGTWVSQGFSLTSKTVHFYTQFSISYPIHPKLWQAVFLISMNVIRFLWLYLEKSSETQGRRGFSFHWAKYWTCFFFFTEHWFLAPQFIHPTFFL